MSKYTFKLVPRKPFSEKKTIRVGIEVTGKVTKISTLRRGYAHAKEMFARFLSNRKREAGCYDVYLASSPSGKIRFMLVHRL